MRDEREDAELEEQLRKAAALVDPLPAQLLQTAMDSFTWRTIDADLAELVFDSMVDQDEDVLVRGPAHARLLSFEAGDMTIDVEITGVGPSRRLIGQLAPPQPAVVEVRQSGGVGAVEADELGRFSAGPLRAGPISVRCSTGVEPDRRRVVTDWVPI